MQQYLLRARTHDLGLEAVLRSCKLILKDENGAVLVCPYRFHRVKLMEERQFLERLFGGKVEIFNNTDDYVKDRMKDPLVRFAVEELGAVISRGKHGKD